MRFGHMTSAVGIWYHRFMPWHQARTTGELVIVVAVVKADPGIEAREADEADETYQFNEADETYKINEAE